MNRPQSHAHPIDPLASTRLQVSITDLVAAYELRHEFRNNGQEAIEAVFSFPMPLDAAFLGMQATLAGETLEARVLPARDASQDYDDAIADGDSAVLLQTPEPGLLCVNLGNLKPGESGAVVLRFATLVAVADRVARFSIPLVNRPRYGRWNLEEMETPAHDFGAEHAISAVVEVRGLLSGLPVTSTTHAARFEQHGEVMMLSLEHAMLDRDVVLTFQLQQDLASTGRLIEESEESVAMVTLLASAKDAPAAPLDLCLLLDCSGSMTGDAIKQSRQALHSVADALTEQDTIQVIRFGSTTSPLFRRPLKASERVRDALRQLVRTVKSDLGGTEMSDAITLALKQLATRDQDGRSSAIVLVTDGAVQPHDVAEAREAARDLGVRVFVVAVGSSAGGEVLAPVANFTSGVLESATPTESIDQAVMRHFRRARQPVPTQLAVMAPEGAELIGCPAALYVGDAATFFARLPKEAADEVGLRFGDAPVVVSVQSADQAAIPAMHALYGAALYRQSDQTREEVALRFGLLTPETSAVLVKQRAGDKGEGLPVIVPVSAMVPHGMLEMCQDIASSSCAMAYASAGSLYNAVGRRVDSGESHADFSPDLEEFEQLPAIPADRVKDLLNQMVVPLYDDYLRGEECSIQDAINYLDPEDRDDAAVLIEHIFSRLTGFDALAVVAMVMEVKGSGGLLIDDFEASMALLSAGAVERLRSAWTNGLPASTREMRW